MPIDPVTGSLIVAGASGAFTAGNTLIAGKQNKKTRRWNAKQAEIKYQRDVDMWNKANLYNSPAAQMQRYKEAGLNPNLIYGQGSPGLASNTLPQYNKPEGEFKIPLMESPVNTALGMYQDMSVKRAQIDNIKAQEEMTRTNRDIALMALPLKMDLLGTQSQQAKDLYLAGRPYYDSTAKFKNLLLKNQNQLVAESGYSKTLDNLKKDYIYRHGGNELELIRLQNEINLRKGQLHLNSLDIALAQQRKDLGAWQVYWANKTKGVSALSNVVGTGSKAVGTFYKP